MKNKTVPQATGSTPRAVGAEARRRRIAQAVATSSKKISEIARDENISRSHASTIANSRECRAEIAKILDASSQTAERLVEQALCKVEESFQADKQVVVQRTEMIGTPAKKRSAARTFEVLNLGPDHFVRLAGVKRLIELLTAGRAVPKYIPPEAESPGMSLEQLEFWADRYWAGKEEEEQANETR